MKILKVAVFAMAACSSSVAQDNAQNLTGVPQVVPQIAAAAAVLEVEGPVPRTALRTSRLENEWFTKICVSEGGFNLEEAKKLLQTLENMREMRSDKSLLNAMYAQSAKVTRRIPFTDTRQIWVSYLRMQGNGPPEKGWVECEGKDPVTKKRVPEGCSGTWASEVEGWVAFREQARELYFSGIVPEPLPGRPIQWGGDMDYHRGDARNFCPVNIGGLRVNTFWARASDPVNAEACLPIDKTKVTKSKVLSAEIASGRAERQRRIPQLLGEHTPQLLDENSLIPQQKQEADDDTTSVD